MAIKPKVYGMKEATVAGISKLVKNAEESGFVLLRRNGAPVAIMMGVSPTGIHALRDMLAQAMTEDAQRLRDNPHLAILANAVMSILDSLPEGPGNAGVRPGSVRQGGVKGRRRKEPK